MGLVYSIGNTYMPAKFKVQSIGNHHYVTYMNGRRYRNEVFFDYTQAVKRKDELNYTACAKLRPLTPS